jgi:hypothetical protein
MNLYEEYALPLALKGFSITPPIPVGDKHPCLKWKQYQTARASLEQIAQWADDFPTFNYGIVTGRISGIVVLEADDHEAIELVTRRCPATPMMQITRKGRHYVYRYPKHLPHVITRAKLTVEGVKRNLDIRGDGGLIVAPGSFWTKDGTTGRYRMVTPWKDIPWEDVPIFDPAWVELDAQKMQPPKGREHQELDVDIDEAALTDRQEQAREWLKYKPGAVEGKGAENYCFAIACELVHGFALAPEDALPVFMEWGTRKDQRYASGGYYPWDEEDLARKLDCAASHPDKDGRPDGYRLRFTCDEQDIIDALADWEAEKDSYFTPPPEKKEVKAMNYLLDLKTHRSIKRSYDWIIDGCYYQGSLNLLGGNPGAGKSVFLTQVLFDVGFGEPVFDRVVSPRPFIWLDWDGGDLHFDYQREIALKNRSEDAINDLYRYATTTPALPSQKPLPAYVTPDFLDLMISAYPGQKGTIVIDCLRSAFCAMPGLPDGWENNNGLMYKLVGGLRDWCHKTGWSIFLIHHRSRGGNIAGAYGIEGASDVIWDFDREIEQTQAKLVIRKRIPREQKLLFDYADDCYVYQGTTAEEAISKGADLKKNIAEGIVAALEAERCLGSNALEKYLHEERKLKYKATTFRLVRDELCQEPYKVIRTDGDKKPYSLKEGYKDGYAKYIAFLSGE